MPKGIRKGKLSFIKFLKEGDISELDDFKLWFHLLYLKEDVMSDRDLCLSVCRREEGGKFYNHLPRKFKMDREFALASVKTYPPSVEFFPYLYRDDQEIVSYLPRSLLHLASYRFRK
jgi:hypothetical protein